MRDSAECRLISDLCTDTEKLQFFSRLGDHYATVASEIERATEKRVLA